MRNPGWFCLLTCDGPPGNQDYLHAGRNGLALLWATENYLILGILQEQNMSPGLRESKSLRHSLAWEPISEADPKQKTKGEATCPALSFSSEGRRVMAGYSSHM